jgi:hypothetical protein
LYSSAVHACRGLWLQIVVLAAVLRVLSKFNGYCMGHRSRILASKRREGVTPNGCRPFFENSEVSLPLPTSRAPPWCFAARTRASCGLMCRPAQRATLADFFRAGPFIFRVALSERPFPALARSSEKETFLQALRDRPFHDASTRQGTCSEVAPLSPPFTLPNALILRR